MPQDAIYLFCFAGAKAAVKADGVWVHRFDCCSAVVTRVPVDEFSEANLQNPDWLVPRATWHEQVVEATMRTSPVLPAPFGTLFSGLESFGQFVDAHVDQIRSFLREVSGREEWSVKVRADKRLVPPAADVTTMPPGQRYLHEKKAGSRTDPVSPLQRAAQEVLGDLGDMAHAHAVRKAFDEEEKRVIAHTAFLVDEDRREAFHALVAAAAQEYQPHGLEFAVSGPWPPYSFVPALSDEPAASPVDGGR